METDSGVRAELEAAIARVSRQIEIQGASRNFAASGPSSGSALVEELQAELSQLQEALAGLESEKPPEEPPSVSEQESDLEEAAADAERGGVLIAMKRRSVDPAVLGRFLLVLGSFGLTISAAVALAHFVFGVPVNERGNGQPSDQGLLEFLAVFASISGFAAARAIAVLRDARRRDANDDLVS